MKKYILVLSFLFISTYSFSQISELGVSIAGSNYIGDIGETQYINPNDLAVGLVYKWNYSTRIVYRLDASYIRINADNADAKNQERKNFPFSFKNSVSELAVGIEFNYYDYSMTREGWSSTPYLILQLAINTYNVVDKQTGFQTNTSNATFSTKNKVGFTIPFGIGYKTKIGNNIGIGFETKVRYTFADDLDYNNTEFEALSFGNPDSNDWYVTTGITIVLGFGRKGCYSGGF